MFVLSGREHAESLRIVDDFRLNKNTKRAWIKHLREPDRQQTTGRLCKRERDTGEKSYCCLGVLGEQMRLFIGWEGDAPGIEVAQAASSSDGFPVVGYLPSSVLPDDIQRFLGRRNDQDGWSFHQIADWVEKYL